MKLLKNNILNKKSILREIFLKIFLKNAKNIIHELGSKI